MGIDGTSAVLLAACGEFGNPFAAGKIGIWPSGRVYTTGCATPRIRDRFRWTLLPEVIAGRGGPPGHSWHDQPNLVTNSATRDGSLEQSTAFSVFLAGEEYQGRVGIDRGHMPVHRAAIGAPTSVAPPPEGMKWLKVYADRPDNRSLFPFSTWREWWHQYRALATKGWVGEQSPAESLQACQDWGSDTFRPTTVPSRTLSRRFTHSGVNHAAFERRGNAIVRPERTPAGRWRAKRRWSNARGGAESLDEPARDPDR